MTDLVELLRAEATSEYVAYTEFMLDYKKSDDILYCFFEGFEDRVYYSVRVKNLSHTKKYLDYVCGGKDQVLKIHDLVKANISYRHAKTGFFVDKDFDDLTYAKSVYVTPTYSIENLYCTEEAVESILVSEFRFNRKDADFKKAMDIYRQLKQIFLQEFALFNAWLSCQADRRNTNKSVRLNIDERLKGLLEQLVTPKLDGVKNIPEIQTKESVEDVYPEAASISTDELLKKVNLFARGNQCETSRGKFIIRFLESFLNRLQNISGTKDNPFSKKYSSNLRFEKFTICSNLSQYAITPECLKQYVVNIS